MSSFNESKENKKRDLLPALSCNPIYIKKFREEAKSKKWSLTTLMNEILEFRYGKIDNESENK